LTTIDGDDFGVGDSDENSIQSISKALTSLWPFLWDERIWERVGVEPSGTAFNSLIQLEHEKGIPRNPFINAGAIVADILVSLKNPKEDFFWLYKTHLRSPTIDYNLK
jgi:glutaminase